MARKILPANKADLIREVADRLEIAPRAANRLVDTVTDSLRALLYAQGGAAIKGFGTFELRTRKGRTYCQPLTGETLAYPDRMTVVLRPSDGLLAELRLPGPKSE